MVSYCLLLLYRIEWCVFPAHTVLFTFQVILSILCVTTLFPSNVLSRGSLRSERRSNTTARSSTDHSSHKLQTPQPRKHTPRNKRPAVHIKERGPIKLTKRPTNSKQVRLFGRVGLFLYCNSNGTVSGSLSQLSNFGEFIRSTISLFQYCHQSFFPPVSREK